MLDPAGVEVIGFHQSWPAPARVLVERAIERHGGLGLWARLRAVTYQLVSLTGVLPWAKGYRRSFEVPRALTTYPHAGSTVWHETAGGPPVAVFDRGDMQLFDPATGAETATSPTHRQSFRGLRKLRRWRRIDACYFFGYAFASYTAVPFVLPPLRFVQLVRGAWQGEPLTGVQVEYPPGAEVHSRVQSYYFDPGGLLRRNDYVADPVGAWATGAHGWDDFVDLEGLPVPTRRTVLWRIGNLVMPRPTVLAASFDGLKARWSSSPPRG